MAKAGYWISTRSMKPIISPHPTETKSPNLFYQASRVGASLKKNELPLLIMKKNHRPWRRLITISTAEGKWHGNWDRDYSFSLRDLQLEDLAEEDGDKNAQVFINLCIHKHAGFGLSVHGRICASFTRKCSNCSAPYCREVIYVKPGCEADLDSLVQDTIRLTTSVNETCSELCEKAEPRIQHLSKQNSASIDKRWSRLLELRKAYQ